VPMLIVHGDNDQRVPPEHFDKYIDALDRAGVDYKKLILENADHFSNTLFYHHKISLYENMLSFLGNDCGLQANSPTRQVPSMSADLPNGYRLTQLTPR